MGALALIWWRQVLPLIDVAVAVVVGCCRLPSAAVCCRRLSFVVVRCAGMMQPVVYVLTCAVWGFHLVVLLLWVFGWVVYARGCAVQWTCQDAAVVLGVLLGCVCLSTRAVRDSVWLCCCCGCLVGSCMSGYAQCRRFRPVLSLLWVFCWISYARGYTVWRMSLDAAVDVGVWLG